MAGFDYSTAVVIGRTKDGFPIYEGEPMLNYNARLKMFVDAMAKRNQDAINGRFRPETKWDAFWSKDAWEDGLNRVNHGTVDLLSDIGNFGVTAANGIAQGGVWLAAPFRTLLPGQTWNDSIRTSQSVNDFFGRGHDWINGKRNEMQSVFDSALHDKSLANSRFIRGANGVRNLALKWALISSLTGGNVNLTENGTSVLTREGLKQLGKSMVRPGTYGNILDSAGHALWHGYFRPHLMEDGAAAIRDGHPVSGYLSMMLAADGNMSRTILGKLTKGIKWGRVGNAVRKALTFPFNHQYATMAALYGSGYLPDLADRLDGNGSQPPAISDALKRNRRLAAMLGLGAAGSYGLYKILGSGGAGGKKDGKTNKDGKKGKKEGKTEEAGR